MKSISISWDEDDLAFEMLLKLAAESGVSPEVVTLRAVAEYLDRYVKSPLIDPQAPPAKTLRELLVNHGVLKP